MNPYKGILKLVCGHDKCRLKQLREDMMPTCLACTEVRVQILDLDNKILFETDNKIGNLTRQTNPPQERRVKPTKQTKQAKQTKQTREED